MCRPVSHRLPAAATAWIERTCMIVLLSDSPNSTALHQPHARHRPNAARAQRARMRRSAAAGKVAKAGAMVACSAAAALHSFSTMQLPHVLNLLRCLRVRSRCVVNSLRPAPQSRHLLDTYLKTVKKWFCLHCIQSGSKLVYYKKPRIPPSTVERSSIVATENDSTSVVTTPEASVTAVSNITTNTHGNAISVDSSLVPAVVRLTVSSNPAISFVDAIRDATSSQSAPVTSAPVLPTTFHL
jgi:hypothetical protein